MPAPPRHSPARVLVACLLLTLSLSTQGWGQTPTPTQSQSSASAAKEDPNDGTAQSQAIAMRLTPLPGHSPCRVTVRLNGQVDASFFVDTGSNFCAVTESLARKLGLTTHTAVSAGGKPFLTHGKPSPAVTINKIEFPGAAVSGPIPDISSEMLVLPDESLVFPPDPAHPHDPGTPCDGVLGATLLKFYAAVFDLQARTLTLYWPGKLSPQQARLLGCLGPGGGTLSMSPPPDHPDYDCFYVSVRLTSGANSRDVSLAVDTGSDTTVVPRAAAQALGLKRTAQQQRWGMEGNFEADTVSVPLLDLGGTLLTGEPVVYPDKGDYFPVLGVDVLSHYRVLLDFPGKTMYLAPADTPIPAQAAPARTDAKPSGK